MLTHEKTKLLKKHRKIERKKERKKERERERKKERKRERKNGSLLIETKERITGVEYQR